MKPGHILNSFGNVPDVPRIGEGGRHEVVLVSVLEGFNFFFLIT